MTERKLLDIQDKVYMLSSRLTGMLDKLSVAASEVLGYEVYADLCGGDEIEFRTRGSDGWIDDCVCIRMEAVLNVLKERNRTKPGKRRPGT